MKTLRTIILLALALSGCGTSYCLDAPADDAGIETGTISSNEACLELEWAYMAGYGASGEPACTLHCPWPAPSRPFLPAERCDPVAVYACARAISGANDCVRYEEALAACPREACR